MKRCPHCATDFDLPLWECPSCSFSPSLIRGFPAFATDLADGGGGFQPEAFAELAALEEGNFWFRARNKLIIWALQRHFPEINKYLEIGCGTGFVLAAVVNSYPHVKATGSEIFSIGLPFASRRVENAELFQMDARAIPYCEEFDVIGAFDVLEHIEEDELVLSEMLRAVKPGGGIVVTVPQHPSLWSVQDEHACHVRRYRRGELRQKVMDAGFQIELETSFVSLLLPAMYASRLTKRKRHENMDLTDELRLPGAINITFEMLMGIERQFIRFGVRFPLGGSLLLVAKKQVDQP